MPRNDGIVKILSYIEGTKKYCFSKVFQGQRNIFLLIIRLFEKKIHIFAGQFLLFEKEICYEKDSFTTKHISRFGLSNK